MNAFALVSSADKELQAEFLTTYNMLEEKKQNAPKIDEIQEDIRKSQND